MVEIARIFTFAIANRRDIVRRLMCCSKSFNNMTFATAMEHFRYFERNGLVVYGDGYLVIYRDC